MMIIAPLYFFLLDAYGVRKNHIYRVTKISLTTHVIFKRIFRIKMKFFHLLSYTLAKSFIFFFFFIFFSILCVIQDKTITRCILKKIRSRQLFTIIAMSNFKYFSLNPWKMGFQQNMDKILEFWIIKNLKLF